MGNLDIQCRGSEISNTESKIICRREVVIEGPKQRLAGGSVDCGVLIWLSNRLDKYFGNKSNIILSAGFKHFVEELNGMSRLVAIPSCEITAQVRPFDLRQYRCKEM
jgi:hypothetical protein